MNWNLRIIFGLSLIGILDTAYLSYARLTSSELACGIVSGCNSVAASPQSVLFGIPLAYLGLFFYLAIFIIAFFLYKENTSGVRSLFTIATGLGFLFSIYFMYIQMFVIEEFCIYCVTSAFVATLLFLEALLFDNVVKGEEEMVKNEHEQ